MPILDLILNLLGLKRAASAKTEQHKSIYSQDDEIEEIHSVWDYLRFNENTQAAHISAVLSFDQWISMDEILRRIREIFGMDYKNDRSLYPYIKTLVDVGVVETSNVGGRKRWRKKDILIKLKGKKKEDTRETEGEVVRAKTSK